MSSEEDTGLLCSYRVLDMGGIPAAFAGKLLGDLGADVIKVESPGGDPVRKLGPFIGNTPGPDTGLVWHALNVNKRSLVLELEEPGDRMRFVKLVESADFLVDSLPCKYLRSLGLGYDDLRRIKPSLIVTSIAPFGQDGPYAALKGSDLVCWALGGPAYLSGHEDRAPLQIGAPYQTYLNAGAEAFLASMIAHFHRETTGFGQHVDVSAQAFMPVILNAAVETWHLNHVILKRAGEYRERVGGSRDRIIWDSSNGHVTFQVLAGPLGAKFLNILVGWMDEHKMAPQWMKDEDWSRHSTFLERRYAERLEGSIARFFRGLTSEQLCLEALRRGLFVVNVNSVAEVLEDAQLKARDFWRQIDLPGQNCRLTYPGYLARTSHSYCGVRSPAPRVGEHTEEILEQLQSRRVSAERRTPRRVTKHALDGVRILDFAGIAVGGQSTLYLAQHGATVIKVESMAHPDGIRFTQPFAEMRPGVDRSGFFGRHNSNKLSIALDMRKPESVQIARKLAEWADVLVENFRPGPMKKWGMDYESLKKTNPGIVYASISGYGQNGPAARQPTFGPLLASQAGFNYLTGWPDRNPVGVTPPYTDYIAPHIASALIVGALEYRNRTGVGQYLDMSQLEISTHLNTIAILDCSANGRILRRMGNRSLNGCPHGVFQCHGDDQWCAITVEDEEEWRYLVRAMGSPAWATSGKFDDMAARKQNEDELESNIELWTVKFSAKQVMDLLQANGVAAGKVQNPQEVLEDPQIKHRRVFRQLPHRELGDFPFMAPSFILSETQAEISRPSPCLGEHTEYVMKEILGMSSAEYAGLQEHGIFA